MSVQFLQSNTPQENQSIKVNDATVRGALSVAESSTLHSVNVEQNSRFKGRITFRPEPVLYTQATSAGTAVAVASCHGGSRKELAGLWDRRGVRSKRSPAGTLVGPAGGVALATLSGGGGGPRPGTDGSPCVDIQNATHI